MANVIDHCNRIILSQRHDGILCSKSLMVFDAIRSKNLQLLVVLDYWQGLLGAAGCSLPYSFRVFDFFVDFAIHAVLGRIALPIAPAGTMVRHKEADCFIQKLRIRCPRMSRFAPAFDRILHLPCGDSYFSKFINISRVYLIAFRISLPNRNVLLLGTEWYHGITRN